MKKLIIRLPGKQRASALEWFKSQRLFPSVQSYTELATGEEILYLGIIASSEQVTMIKIYFPEAALLGDYRS